jgi:hypothetical protein
MTIPIWNSQTGQVWIRDFDYGILNGIGASLDTTCSDQQKPTFAINIAGPTESKVPVFFNDPEQIYKHRHAPSILIQRDDFTPALNRWMGVGQLEYRAAVYGSGGVLINGTSGFAQYVSKPQAMPYDFVYTITCFDNYEGNVQFLVKQVLKSFPPIGKIWVTDSLGLLRSYESRSEGPIPSPRENIDPVNRFVSYTISVKVDGEIDLTDPIVADAVSGFSLNLHRF